MDKILDEQNIKPIEITPGAPVEGEAFFGREREMEMLRDTLLRSGTSVFIPGPRRWGKSSYVKECMKRYKEVLNGIYINLHSVHSIKQFYDLLVKQKSNSGIEFYSIVAKDGFKNIFNSLTSLLPKVIVSDVELETGNINDKTNYEMMESLTIILRNLKEKNIILILDEISDFVTDIKKNDSEDEAVNFLKWLRTLRNSFGVQMVITGSISITSVLRKLKAEDLINDMKEVELKPLSKKEGILFFKCLLQSREIKMDGDALKFCEQKINKEAHYFIQLFADNIVSECIHGQIIETDDEIQEIYSQYISKPSVAFEDYHSRLKEHFNATECKCAKLVLGNLYDNTLDFESIYGLTGDILPNKQQLLELLIRLKEEGYIIQNKNGYTFISGILADYWHEHFRYDKGGGDYV